MKHTTSKAAKPARRPPRPRRLPDLADLPPLIRVSDLWSNRSAGKFGLTPLSRKQIEDRIKAHNLRVVRLGPRSACLDKATVLALTSGAFA
jgi:hypothetical protein